MSAFFDPSRNYSFYAIPLAWFFTLIPGFYSKKVALKDYDLATPRQFVECVQKDETLSKATKNKILRCEAAAANGRETLGLFIGAILAANHAGVPVADINMLAAAYLASRIVYNFTYVILQENRKWAPLRSIAWIVGVSINTMLFIQAGNRL
ncbi:hypothetical protein GGS21DRAFT_472036 [Xylaria nigripes]|nr:hypothetical protein GGS21DRAFT_472036 [Xylaria nigripes]